MDQTEADGNNNIKVILPKVQVKPAARQSVSAKAEAQNALIDQSDLSTEEERLAAKHLVEQALIRLLIRSIMQIRLRKLIKIVSMLKILFQKLNQQQQLKQQRYNNKNIATHKINLIKSNNEATDEEQNAAIAQVEQALIKANNTLLVQ